MRRVKAMGNALCGRRRLNFTRYFRVKLMGIVILAGSGGAGNGEAALMAFSPALSSSVNPELFISLREDTLPLFSTTKL